MIECEYLDSDREFLLNAYDKIVENESAKNEWEIILKVYNNDIKCDYYNGILVPAQNAGKLVGVHPYTSGLLIFMCMSKHLKELYIERGISLDIFKRSKLEHEYDKNGHKLNKESKVINIHIPRDGTPFDENSCIEAYKMAKEFFKEIDGDEKPFICHSWLLYPKHEEILNHNSNTYKFFSRFDVFEYGDNEGEDLWRLFDTEDRNPDRLPTNTSFRRNYVEHLKKGGLVGWGLGIFFF